MAKEAIWLKAWRFLSKLDWLLLLSVAALCLVGLFTLKSTLLTATPAEQEFFWRHQLTAIGLGVAFLFGLLLFDYRYFYYLTPLFYLLVIALLGGVLFLGQEIRGVSRWYQLGSFLLQPSEVFKGALILSWSGVLAFIGERIQQLRWLIFYLFLVLAPVGLVIMEPDLGMALSFLAVGLGLLFMSGLGIKKVSGVLLLGILIVPLLYSSLADYQKTRLQSFFNPGADPLGADYSVIQARIAVGSGQWRGRGWGLGTQSHLNFLPEQRTDFIFAVLAEEMGFWGSIAVLLFYVLFLWRCLIIAGQAPDQLGFLSASGVGLLIGLQMGVNIAMNLGLLPVTGLTLPWISYGGSSMLGNLVLVGIVLSIARQSRV